MIEPVDLDDFFITFFASAMIILMGALYALFFTLAKHLQKSRWYLASYCSYGALVMNVLILAHTLHLQGFWQSIVWVMLFGYFTAPHAIWYLCVATHGVDEAAANDVTLTGEESIT